MSLAQFRNFWRPLERTAMVNECGMKHAWGEPTPRSLERIWDAILDHAPPTEKDILLDWGAGRLKFLLSSRFFCPFRTVGIGVEIDDAMFQLARQILEASGQQSNFHLFHRDSASFSTAEWEKLGVSIVVQYDGPAVQNRADYHRKIMQNLLATSTVRVVFSTKMNPALFADYFQTSHPSTYAAWKCARVPNLRFGNSSYLGFLWFREGISENSRSFLNTSLCP